MSMGRSSYGGRRVSAGKPLITNSGWGADGNLEGKLEGGVDGEPDGKPSGTTVGGSMSGVLMVEVVMVGFGADGFEVIGFGMAGVLVVRPSRHSMAWVSARTASGDKEVWRRTTALRKRWGEWKPHGSVSIKEEARTRRPTRRASRSMAFSSKVWLSPKLLPRER